ncbi:hypothetical protein, partial [Acetobacter senegalensis]|uniref:hypothetical protein n=1 Tax=Acetobacter senegalensis TaxID=446692 RepID=UPI00264B6F28
RARNIHHQSNPSKHGTKQLQSTKAGQIAKTGQIWVAAILAFRPHGKGSQSITMPLLICLRPILHQAR